MASVFGSTSPKISTSAVMANVATATPLSPKTRVNSAVASDADRMLTMLLPKSSAPIIRSLSSVTFIAVSAPREPLSACAFSLARDEAVKAVSDPEKKADMKSRITMNPAVSQKAVSKAAVFMGYVALVCSGRDYGVRGRLHQA